MMTEDWLQLPPDFSSNVLVCDDEGFLHDIIPDFLSHYFGHVRLDPHHCSGIDEVKELLKTGQNIDIAVLDINFAKGSRLDARYRYEGLEILELLKGNVSTQYVEAILITGWTESFGADAVIRALRAGALDWLRKEENPVSSQLKCYFCGRQNEGRDLTLKTFASCDACGAPLQTLWRQFLLAFARALYTVEIKKRAGLLRL